MLLILRLQYTKGGNLTISVWGKEKYLCVLSQKQNEKAGQSRLIFINIFMLVKHLNYSDTYHFTLS